MGQEDGEGFLHQSFSGQDLTNNDLDFQGCDFRLRVVRRVDKEQVSQMCQSSIPTSSISRLDSVQINGLSLQGLETQSVGLGNLLGDTGIVLCGDQRAEKEEVQLVGCRWVGGGAGPG